MPRRRRKKQNFLKYLVSQAGRLLVKTAKFSRNNLTLVMILLAVAGLFLVWRLFAATQTTAFTPTADSYVSRNRPKNNYGTSASLQTQAGSTTSDRRDTVLQFNTSTLPEGRITKATLSLYATGGASAGGNVYAANSGWYESSVNWNNKPAISGSVLGSMGAVVAGNWYTVDVTTGVAGRGTLSFRITNSARNGAVFASKERGAAFAPKLSVSVEPVVAINTVDSRTTPEGTKIEINTQGNFNYESIYKLLKDNAYPGDFATIAPHLTIRVQDAYPSQVSNSTSDSGGICTNTNLVMYLKGKDSSFANNSSYVMAHEYGHVWSLYHLCKSQNNSWSRYLAKRWSNASGSVTLAQDSRLDSSYNWSKTEMIGDDYRLLFGTPESKSMNFINFEVVDPRNQPGLREWLLNTWGTKQF